MIDPVNLYDYEQLARERLPQMVYDYYAGGAGDEITLRESERAWAHLRLRPRVLVDVSACDSRTTILGRPVSMPVMAGPCALNALAHPEGEIAVARAAAAADVVQIVSTLSSYPMEEVAQASAGKLWFQLYCYRDRSITRDLAMRAEAAGFAAICVTVDVPVPGPRERDTRNRFKVPPQHPCGQPGTSHKRFHRWIRVAQIYWRPVRSRPHMGIPGLAEQRYRIADSGQGGPHRRGCAPCPGAWGYPGS